MNKRFRTIAIALFISALLSAITLPFGEGDAEEVGTLQRSMLYLGGTGGNNPLSPILQGFQYVEVSSHPLAAREGFIIGVPGSFGTWASGASMEEFRIGDRVNYTFWVSGDVRGVSLEVILRVGGESQTHITDSIDLENFPQPLNGSFNLQSTLYGNPGEQIVLEVNWRGGQNAGESIQNNTAELWYGINSRASGISIFVDSVHISEVTSEDHPTAKDSIMFKIKATSIFGPKDLVNVSIFHSVSIGVLGDVQEFEEDGYTIFSIEWDYSTVGFPEGSFEISLSIQDLNGNWWNRTDSLVILIPEEYVDLDISYSQVILSSLDPIMGDNVTITVTFTGKGKNWISVPFSLDVYDNNATFGHVGSAATLGTNGPYSFNWTPSTPGEHEIKVVLDESAIDADGLDDTNNIVEISVKVMPPFVEDIVGSGRGSQAYLLSVGIVVLVVLISTTLLAMLIGSRKKKKREGSINMPGPEGPSTVPLPQHAPDGSPHGFFVHTTGQPTMWVDTTSRP